MSTHSESPLDSALRAVGRTIVNFQRLEHNLKLAARLGSLQGTITKVQRDNAKRNELAASLTLGQAIQAWLAHGENSPAQTSWSPDLFDVSIQTTFTLEPDVGARRSHAEALRALLEVRNNLVHSRLAAFEWKSLEACANLVVELDGVNAAIVEQIAYISSLLATIAELYKEHAAIIVASVKAGADSTFPNDDSA